MALKTLKILDLFEITYDDTKVTVPPIDVDGPIRSNSAPSNSADVVRLADVGAGGVAAPIGATYVVVTADSDLTSERILTAGTFILISDSGANSAITIDFDTTSYFNISNDIAVGATNGFYIGDRLADGSWRIKRSGTDLVFERKIAGVWVTKNTIAG